MGSRARAAGALSNLIWTLRKEDHLKHAIQLSLPSLRRAFSHYDQINLIDNVPDHHLAFNGTENGMDHEGSLRCVGNMLMSWAPIKISDITPDRKKTLKPQQNGQSADGAVSNGSSNSRARDNKWEYVKRKLTWSSMSNFKTS